MFSWLFAEKKTDGAADDGPRDLPEPDPALFERANWRPVDEASRSVQRSVQLGATGSSRGRGAASSSGSCLFDRYGDGTVRTTGRPEGIGANGTTSSARLRASGVLRLMCHVNIDDRGSPAEGLALLGLHPRLLAVVEKHPQPLVPEHLDDSRALLEPLPAVLGFDGAGRGHALVFGEGSHV